MTADIQKCSKLATLIAYEQHRETAGDPRRERTSGWHLVDDSGAHPVPLENRLALAIVEFARTI